MGPSVRFTLGCSHCAFCLSPPAHFQQLPGLPLPGRAVHRWGRAPSHPGAAPRGLLRRHLVRPAQGE